MDYPDDLIFSLEITNGYVFRQIFELYDKLVIEGIPVFLKESGVTIRASTVSTGDSRKFCSDIEIFTDDIIEYYINTDLTTIKKDESDTPCQIEKIDMCAVKTVLKSITKAKSVRLYKNVGDDEIRIQIKGVNVENTKISPGRYKYKSSDYDVSKFEDINTVPNIKIDIGQFCDTLKGVTRDTDITNFKVYERGMIVEAQNTIGSIIKDNRWGNLEGECTQCVIGTNFVKALCKINGMANYSIVKIFSNKNGCLKLNHKIGDFAEHNIYISEC